MSRYTDRYRTPSPLFPNASPTSLARVLAAWETLRNLNLHGYRTSAAQPPSTWLTKIRWADGRSSGRSVGRGTTCSPFVTQATALAYSSSTEEPYAPVLSDGRALPLIFSHAANGVLKPDNRVHKKMMDQYGMTMADNEWPRPIIFFNMGYAVEPEQLRRGDAVHIDWMNGGGHAVFCWDVHLNDRGEVDAFLYVSSNGSMTNGGFGGGISVGGTSRGAGNLISLEGEEYRVHKTPLFVDDERYVVEGAWVTWDDAVAGKLLTDMRGRPKTRVKKVRKLAAARFHGVDPSLVPLYAMGQDQPGPFVAAKPASTGAVSVPEVQTKQVLTAEDVATVQRRLKLLFLVGWLKTDVGKVDGKAGRMTTSAVIEFQRAQGLRPDGKPGRLTMARLESVFRSACDAPQAKKYLNPGRPGGLVFASENWQESARLYFRHGVVKHGGSIELILSGEDLPQRSFGVSLLDAKSLRPVGGKDIPLSCQGARTSIQISLPESVSDGEIIAKLVGFDLETEAPLRVLPGGL